MFSSVLDNVLTQMAGKFKLCDNAYVCQLSRILTYINRTLFEQFGVPAFRRSGVPAFRRSGVPAFRRSAISAFWHFGV